MTGLILIDITDGQRLIVAVVERHRDLITGIQLVISRDLDDETVIDLRPFLEVRRSIPAFKDSVLFGRLRQLAVSRSKNNVRFLNPVSCFLSVLCSIS